MLKKSNSMAGSLKAMRINALVAAVCILFTAVVGGCNPAPEGVLSPEDMAQLLADIHTGESVSETERRTFSNDSMRRVLKQSILLRHGLTTEEFDSSLMWYGKHIDLYAKVYDRVIEILEDRVSHLESEGVYNGGDNGGDVNLAGIEFDGDSIDVWTAQRSMILTDKSPSTQIPFHLVNDPNWQPGDRYILNVTAHGIQSPMGLTMAVEYYDGSVDYTSSQIVGDGHRQIKLPLDSAKNAHYVYGLISTRPKKDNRLYLDSISLYRVRLAPYNAGERFNVKHLKRTRP